MNARTLQFAVAIFFMEASLPMRAIENAIAPIVSRADFTIRDPKFAKVVEKEINKPAFRQKLARAAVMPLASALAPVAKVSYRPDSDQGGTLVLWFEDLENKLSHDHLERLWGRVEVYIVYRFQGNSSRDSEVRAFGASPAEI
jgi:hypothetical protein